MAAQWFAQQSEAALESLAHLGDFLNYARGLATSVDELRCEVATWQEDHGKQRDEISRLTQALQDSSLRRLKETLLPVMVNLTDIRFNANLLNKGADGAVEFMAWLHNTVVLQPRETLLLQIYAPPQRLAQGSLIPFLTALQTTPFVHLVLAEPEQIGTRISTDLTRLSLVHPLSSRTYYVGKRVTGVNPEIEDNLIHVTLPLASAMLEEAGGNLAAPPSPSKTRRPPASILHMPTSSVKGRSYSSLVASEPSAAPRASNADGGLTSPSVTVPPTNTTAADTFVIKRNGNGSKVVDETKPLHKNNPAPCNRFYLTPAGCAVPCNFCHEYQLTLAQMTTLALDAKKSPCTYLLNGKICPQGDQCHMGHVCPRYPQCPFEERCRFYTIDPKHQGG